MTTLTATEEALLDHAFRGSIDVRRAVIKLIAEQLASVESALTLGGALTVGGAAGITGKLTASGKVNLVGSTATPASAAAAGAAGDVAYDGSFIYVCFATNTWLRAAIATW